MTGDAGFRAAHDCVIAPDLWNRDDTGSVLLFQPGIRTTSCSGNIPGRKALKRAYNWFYSSSLGRFSLEGTIGRVKAISHLITQHSTQPLQLLQEQEYSLNGQTWFCYTTQYLLVSDRTLGNYLSERIEETLLKLDPKTHSGDHSPPGEA